jgi:hypothetical protein
VLSPTALAFGYAGVGELVRGVDGSRMVRPPQKWLACFVALILAVVGVLGWALFATGYWPVGLVVAAVPVLAVLYVIGRLGEASK